MNRKDFLIASSAAPAVAAQVPGGLHLVERRADFDAASFDRIAGRPAKIRQLFETIGFRPAVLGGIKNSLNGLQFGFGYTPESIAIALAGHGPSAVYGYSDYLWAKYRIGEFFKLKDASGAPIATNIFLRRQAQLDSGADPDDAAGMYQDASIEMLQRRGVIVLTCHTAVEEQARALVKAGFASPSMRAPDVAADILEHLVPGALVVPSMVATIAVLQARYGYAYLTPAS